MSSKSATKSASAPRFHDLDLREQVRRARENQRELLLRALSSEPEVGGSDQDDLAVRVGAVLGVEDELSFGDRNEDYDLYFDVLAAAYALGVAAGLEVRSDLFETKRGAR